MNVFLPYASFPHSVASLDYRRLGKQRLEILQLSRILQRLRGAELPPNMPRTLAEMVGAQRRIGYATHPALRMWRGYEPALALYQTFAIREWVARGYKNTIPAPYDESWQPNPEAVEYCGSLPPADKIAMPEWLNDTVLHAGYRSKLYQKDPEWYGQFPGFDGPIIEYTWPHQLGYEYL